MDGRFRVSGGGSRGGRERRGLVDWAVGGLLGLAWPALWYAYSLRTRTDGKYRHSWRQRLGLSLPERPPGPGCIWVHALSVGETISVVPLVRELARRGAPIVFSSATETGQAVARQRLGDTVRTFFFLPHDFLWSGQQLIERLRPRLFVLVETDLWPNLLFEMQRHRVPAVLVNGRLSPRSFQRLMAVRSVMAPVLERFDALFAQSEEDARRFEALGGERRRIHCVGNLKYDASGVPLTAEAIGRLRAELGIEGGRPVWIAGSTHPGEEEILLDVARALRARFPDLLLILAPRDTRRAPELAARFRIPLRSQGEPASGKAVYLLDTMGELANFYALADVAFVGGSLVPFGGHNPLEASVQGKPVLWGPHPFNFREIETDLVAAGCGRRVESGDELREVLAQWLADGQIRLRMQRDAQRFIEVHAGTSRRIADLLGHYLRRKPGAIEKKGA